jgi:hypothetical protein
MNVVSQILGETQTEESFLASFITPETCTQWGPDIAEWQLTQDLEGLFSGHSSEHKAFIALQDLVSKINWTAFFQSVAQRYATQDPVVTTINHECALSCHVFLVQAATHLVTLYMPSFPLSTRHSLNVSLRYEVVIEYGRRGYKGLNDSIRFYLNNGGLKDFEAKSL